MLRGAAYTLRTTPDRQGLVGTALISGVLARGAADHPLVCTLPPMLVVPGSYGRALPRWELYVRALEHEAQSLCQGGRAVAARLVEILLIEALRRAVHTGAVRVGWLRGLSDDGVHRALQAFHQVPGHKWSVAELARVADQSRSAFAARFSTLLGESPMAYARRWRLHLARALLRESDLPLDAVAARAGYGSLTALSIAFARAQQPAPGRYRVASRKLGSGLTST
jgi:AraC-like DNA-binding protein